MEKTWCSNTCKTLNHFCVRGLGVLDDNGSGQFVQQNTQSILTKMAKWYKFQLFSRCSTNNEMGMGLVIEIQFEFGPTKIPCQLNASLHGQQEYIWFLDHIELLELFNSFDLLSKVKSVQLKKDGMRCCNCEENVPISPLF